MCIDLEKNIFNTIIYFDIFNFPLTSFEIWKNLYSKYKIELKDVLYCLDNSNFLKTKISQKDSFYFLQNRDFIVEKRKNNYFHSYKKYKNGIKFINFISNFNFIKAVFIANSMSIDNARNDSDIDLFVITKKNRIWLARMILVLVAQFLNLRPTEKSKKDKICLTIFLDEKNLNLKKVCSQDDIYYIYWINQVVPIFDPCSIYSRFIFENSWSREKISNIFEYKTGYKRSIENKFYKKIIRKITKVFSINLFNKISKKIEMKMFPLSIKKIIQEGNTEDVYVDDTMIKLHNNNNRKYFQNLFLEKIKE